MIVIRPFLTFVVPFFVVVNSFYQNSLLWDINKCLLVANERILVLETAKLQSELPTIITPEIPGATSWFAYSNVYCKPVLFAVLFTGAIILCLYLNSGSNPDISSGGDAVDRLSTKSFMDNSSSSANNGPISVIYERVVTKEVVIPNVTSNNYELNSEILECSPSLVARCQNLLTSLTL